MRKISLKKPILICLYGFPGSGKSYVAANLAKSLQIAHVSADKIRGELFTHPTGSAQEENVASKIAFYITKEFLSSGAGVVYDAPSMKISQRRRLQDLASRHGAGYLMIWLQIDQDSAFARAATRDKRTLEGRYAASQTRNSFDRQLAEMENPKNEDYLVLSGKHTFASQKSAIVNRLYQMGLVDSSFLTENVTKPELVNLVPNMPRPGIDVGRSDSLR